MLPVISPLPFSSKFPLFVVCSVDPLLKVLVVSAADVIVVRSDGTVMLAETFILAEAGNIQFITNNLDWIYWENDLLNKSTLQKMDTMTGHIDRTL